MGVRSFLFDSPIVYRFFQSGVTRNNALNWLVSEVVQPRPTDRVLDIGCGVATILNYLPTNSYVGVDHNSKYIDRAKRVHQGRGDFLLADLNVENFPQIGQFDIVLLIGVLHHLSDTEVSGLVEQIRKTLTSSGRLVTLDTTTVSGQHPVARVLARSDRGRYARSPEHYRQLLETGLRVNEEIVRHDLLRIPYSHVAFSCDATTED